jgi:serine/threonine protein kinase
MRSSLARHLAAFREAVGKLETYYRDLPAPPPTPPQGELLPYPNSFTSLLDNTLQNFDYVKRAIGDKLLFLGQLPDKRTICIKFVRQYSAEAHKCCAQLGFAPQLFGFKSLPGGWSMVVMDWLGPDKWCPLDEITITRKDVDPLILSISQLHQSGYGHGDLRAANILVSKSDPKRYMIVDFDWAGTLGIVRYPMNVNRVEIWRPDSVVDEALILAEHDVSMLEHMPL